MKNLLQRVVFPEIKDIACDELFLRKTENVCRAFGKQTTSVCELYFNTWMNLFAAKKWFYYTVITDLYLGLDIQGDFSVEIIGSNRNTAYNRIDENIVCKEYKDNLKPVYIQIKDPQKYEAIYFTLRYPKENACNIHSIGWYTESEARIKNKLAIVTCTFKREEYIYRTLEMFENYLDSNEQLKDRMHLFVIDNGKTLKLNDHYKYADIYYNMNAGGAGGFGRGLIEACKADENYTRCLFMDDDVEIIPESFYRTLTLSDYLKEKYKNALVNGAMLDIYNKNMFFENLAMQEGIWLRPYHSEANLFNYDDVLRVNHIPEEVFYNSYPKVDGGWYYCSFAMDKKESINNLPLPIFIRGDDAEYGFRHHGEVFISLNGICIWHAPFYYRVNKVTDSYYLYRNMFIINAIYTDNFKNTYQKYYKDAFKHMIDTYDYVSARLIIEAQKDILKGSKIFDENPEEIMQRLNLLGKEENIPVTDPYELWNVKYKNLNWKLYRRIINKFIKKIYKCIPYTKCLIKKNGENQAPEWFPPVDVFLIKKNVKVYNLLKETSVVRKFDYKLEKKLTVEFDGNLKKINRLYDELEKDYKNEFKRITSYEFWKNYLNL